jgi:hypothetical protein
MEESDNFNHLEVGPREGFVLADTLALAGHDGVDVLARVGVPLKYVPLFFLGVDATLNVVEIMREGIGNDGLTIMERKAIYVEIMEASW